VMRTQGSPKMKNYYYALRLLFSHGVRSNTLFNRRELGVPTALADRLLLCEQRK
jgi:hypothetical protein